MASNRFLEKQTAGYNGDIEPMAEETVLRIGLASDTQYKRVNWHNTKLLVRTCLDIDEYAKAVQYILDSCRTEDGAIDPTMIDFAERISIIVFYALVQLPKDYGSLFRLVYVSDLYDTVCSAVCKAQIEAIKRSVNIMIRE